MSIVFLIIIIVLVLTSIQKGEIALIFSCVFLQQLRGYHPLSMYGTIALITSFFLLLKYGKYTFRYLPQFPLKWGFGAILISSLLTNLFVFHLSTIIVVVVDIIMYYYLWLFLTFDHNDKNIYFAISFLLVLSLLVAIYGFVEVITERNEYLRWVQNVGLANEFELRNVYRFGLKRCFTFFFMHTTSGFVAACYGITLLFLKTYSRYMSKNNFLYIFVTFIALAMVCLFSGSRADMFFILISLSMYFSAANTKTWLSIGFLLIVISIGANQLVEMIIQSFVDTESVAGSNSSMRATQLAVSWEIAKESLLWGHGIGYTYTELIMNHTADLYGAESILYNLLIDSGIIGVLAYLILLLDVVRYCVKSNMSKVCFFVVAFVCCNLMTSLPGVPYYYYVPFVLLMIAACRVKVLAIKD